MLIYALLCSNQHWYSSINVTSTFSNFTQPVMKEMCVVFIDLVKF